MKKTNYEIVNELYEKYIEDEDLNEMDKVISSIPKLIQNNLGCALYFNETYQVPTSIGYRFSAKFIQKYNKKIKKNRREPIQYEFGPDDDFGWTNYDPKLLELTKYILDEGIYVAQLNDNNYCILHNDINQDACKVSTKLFFIGNDWKKWRIKFNKKFNEYKKIAKYKQPENIKTSRGYTETIFKSFDKFVMPNKKQVLKYIDNWIDNIPKYHNKYDMIPKLSILLYGDPGTGKSTFYKALAKYLNINTITIVDKDFLMNNREHRLSKSIYAIDDIDCLCKSRKNSKNNDNDNILSTLLEFLDNPPVFQYKLKDGSEYPIQIVVATTNYYDRLDPAVRRYGRFDLQIEMKEFDNIMAQEMCNIYDLKLSDVVKDSDNKNFKISPSKLQAMCLNNIDITIKNGLKVQNGLIRISQRNNIRYNKGQ